MVKEDHIPEQGNNNQYSSEIKNQEISSAENQNPKIFSHEFHNPEISTLSSKHTENSENQGIVNQFSSEFPNQVISGAGIENQQIFSHEFHNPEISSLDSQTTENPQNPVAKDLYSPELTNQAVPGIEIENRQIPTDSKQDREISSSGDKNSCLPEKNPNCLESPNCLENPNRNGQEEKNDGTPGPTLCSRCKSECGEGEKKIKIMMAGLTNYRPRRAPAILTPPNTEEVKRAPVPEALPVPLCDLPHTSFMSPRPYICSQADIEKFHDSEGGRHFLGFVVALSDSISGHKISDECVMSDSVNAILEVLITLETWIDDFPAFQPGTTARYGSPVFRKWQGRLKEMGPQLLTRVLPSESIVELFPYFADSFGNSARTDYGTGHEANFAAWLYCLARLGIIRETDYQAVVSRVFVKYLRLMRRLQTTYRLEPAGSHGVWGLDDYHFLPFIFGSSQLVGHKYMKPKSIHNQDILDHFSNEYMYLSCVKFAIETKKGHLAEHSPMIDDISSVPNWAKVNSGMLKMYKAEVLEKVPIMQHFMFGSLIRWE